MKAVLINIVRDIALLQCPEAAFYSEASFQLSLGIELFKRLGVTARLEMRVPGTGEYLDVFYQHKRSRIGIELKYKTRATTKPGFEYLNQGAQNNGRYDVLRDVERLESFKKANAIDKGFGIFVTNDKYYMSTIGASAGVAPFELSEGRIIPNTLKAGWVGRTSEIRLASSHSVKWISANRAPTEAEEVFQALIFEI
ncbi:hypothetical protein [Oleiharenicola lentus]|uniref:hypothetical protein n=1 Tax=Oleiharenicola lentus TaxID=2508720 RepID=UPI003F67ACA8